MAQIFLSYSRADRQFVDELVPLLRRVYGNNSIWFDDDIPGGAVWWRLILSEIARCELFIYLISNDSLESPYCQAEFREALRLRKQVLPVIVRPKTEYPGRAKDDLQPVLRDIQFVDMTRGLKDSTAGAQLYASINRLLAQVPPQLPTPIEAEPVAVPDVPDKSTISKRASRLTAPRAIIVTAILAGVFVIIAAAIVLGRDGEKNGPGEEAIGPAPTSIPAGSPNNVWTPVVDEFNGVEVVYVPAGCFKMGAEHGYDNEKPVHDVCLSDYWIGRTEVTNAQYKACVDAGACTPPGDRKYYDDPVYAGYPVVYMDWQQANEYAAWMGCGLPTEAQWEYAGRGPEGWTYPWGDEEPTCDRANITGCEGGPARVGGRSTGASWVGALDMCGNVWEWMSDQYAANYYDALNDGVINPTSPAVGDKRVLRGGAFNLNSFDARSAFRDADFPNRALDDQGIRVVCARPPSP